MKVSERVLRNTGFLTLPQAVGVGLQFVFTIAIARYLGSTDFGLFSFSLVFVQIFFSVSKLGTYTVIVRDIARDKAQSEKFTQKALTFRLLLFIFFTTLIAITINIIGYPSEIRNAVYILTIGVGLASVFQVFLSIFRAFENMKYEGISFVIMNGIYLTVGSMMIVNDYGVIGLAVSHLFGNIIYCLYIYLVFNKKFKYRLRLIIDISFFKYILKEGVPIGVGGTACFVYSNLDIVLLSLLRSPAEVGLYSVAKKLCSFLMNFPVAFYGSLFPIWSNYYKTDLNALKNQSMKICKYMGFLAIPIAMFFLVHAEQIVLVLYGQEYSSASNALYFLVWIVVFTFIGNAFAFLLNSTDNSKEYAKLSVITLILFLSTSLPLITLFGIKGAAAASMFSQGTGIALFYMVVNKKLFLIPLRDILVKPVSAGLVMLFIMYMSQNTGLVWGPFLGAGGYILFFYLIKGFPLEDIQSAKSFLKKAI